MLFPATYEVSNADTERQVIERMVAQMERVARDQEEIDRIAPTITGGRGKVLNLTPYQVLIVASMIEREAKTDADRAEDRPRDLQPPGHGHAAARSTPRVLYGPAPASIPPPAVRATSSANDAAGRDNTYLTRAGCRRRRSPTRGGRRSRRRCTRPPNPSTGDPLCAGVPAAQCLYLYYVLADEDGNHAFAVTARAAPGRTCDAGHGLPACSTVTAGARRRGRA